MSLSPATNQLGVKLYSMLSKKKKNVFFSPFATSTAIAMLLCAAEGETASELRSALGYDDVGISALDVASTFEQQLTLLSEDSDSSTLAFANAILCLKGIAVKDEYQKILERSFGATCIKVDAKEAVNLINDFVKEKTNNMIPKFLQNLPEFSQLVLVNVIYFKGVWMRQFKKERTSPQAFYNNGLDGMMKDVDMMHIKEDFLFFKDNTLQVLQLPFTGKDIAMLIFLPRERDGLETIEINLMLSFVKDSKNKLREKKVVVSLPRFRLDCCVPLVECFNELGVKRVFLPGAELYAASDSRELALSEILNQSVLVITEEGTEAASVTTGGMAFAAPTCDHDPVFCVDHPFFFIIYDTKSDMVLFMGRITEL